MDPTNLNVKDMINYLWGIAAVAFGWDVNNLYKLKEDHKDLAVKVATDYVTREEHFNLNQRMDEKLDKILDKLDTKEDKHHRP